MTGTVLTSRTADSIQSRSPSASTAPGGWSQKAGCTEAAGELHGALSLWRGPVLAGLDSPALQPKIANLHQQRLTIFVEYAELQLIRGEQASLLGELTEWAADNPLDERLVGQLMRAHFYDGAPALALMVYEHARRTLRDELGVEPSPQLQEIFHRILANERPALAARVPRG